MSSKQLRERLRGFLQIDFQVYLFKMDGQTVGHALANMRRTGT